MYTSFSTTSAHLAIAFSFPSMNIDSDKDSSVTTFVPILPFVNPIRAPAALPRNMPTVNVEAFSHSSGHVFNHCNITNVGGDSINLKVTQPDLEGGSFPLHKIHEEVSSPDTQLQGL